MFRGVERAIDAPTRAERRIDAPTRAERAIEWNGRAPMILLDDWPLLLIVVCGLLIVGMVVIFRLL